MSLTVTRLSPDSDDEENGMDWMGMDGMSMAVIYLGTGAALGWLRRGQGHRAAVVLLAGLAWPMDLLAGWLALLGDAAVCRE
ncbi:MAG TPA: hypothetical protein PLW81_01405 [Thiobacillaceae bacterium]|nr:hypothetical protein [Thiobacillaceae bacterium]